MILAPKDLVIHNQFKVIACYPNGYGNSRLPKAGQFWIDEINATHILNMRIISRNKLDTSPLAIGGRAKASTKYNNARQSGGVSPNPVYKQTSHL